MSYRNQQTHINNEGMRPMNRQEQFSKQSFTQSYLDTVPRPLQYDTSQPQNTKLSSRGENKNV